MDRIDEFASMFKRAEREPYLYEKVSLDSVILVADGSRSEAEWIQSTLVHFLPNLQQVHNWQLVVGDEFSNVSQLLDLLNKQPVDLVITYRHLQEESLIPQHSLGVYLDVLSQVTEIPVLVLPGTAAHPLPLEGQVCDRVMVVTDHISGDSRLINYGVGMCRDGDAVWLCHVEDDAVFERYMWAIGRIPDIDTEQARTLIEAQLLKDARDFIETCIAQLREQTPNIATNASVERGHQLTQYQHLVESHNIDLVVTNTKDEDQMAMHGMAYSLAVEMNDVALLLL